MVQSKGCLVEEQAVHAQIERFLSYLKDEKGHSDNTIAAYRNDLSQFTLFIEHQLSETTGAWRQINESLIQAYGDHLYQRIEEHEYAASTVARKIAAVKSFFSYLMDKGVLAHNPASGLSTPKVEKPFPRILTPEEINRLLAQPAQKNTPQAQRDRAMLELLYAIGIRVSEIVALRMSELDLSESRMIIQGRNDRSRSLSLTAQACDALSVYLARGRAALLKDRTAETVFVNQRGKPLTRQGLWLIIKSYATTAGMGPDFTPHTLRHSCAAHRLAEGADLQQVRELLGHANISTTQIYQEMIRTTASEAGVNAS